MSRKTLSIVALLVVLTVGMSASASAQWGCGGFGGYPAPSYPTYHNTSHYDYHPGGFQQHGNHFHYVPGHYDFHQTGHYHW